MTPQNTTVFRYILLNITIVTHAQDHLLYQMLKPQAQFITDQILKQEYRESQMKLFGKNQEN